MTDFTFSALKKLLKVEVEVEGKKKSLPIWPQKCIKTNVPIFKCHSSPKIGEIYDPFRRPGDLVCNQIVRESGHRCKWEENLYRAFSYHSLCSKWCFKSSYALLTAVNVAVTVNQDG